MNWQNNEKADKFNFLGVTLESTGGCNKEKTLAKTEGYRAVIHTDKWISVNPIVKIQMLGSVYEMVCEAKIVYGIEV
jgi:hypothetical protein